MTKNIDYINDFAEQLTDTNTFMMLVPTAIAIYPKYTPVFYFSSRRRHTRWPHDWSSDVCSSDLHGALQKSGYFPQENTQIFVGPHDVVRHGHTQVGAGRVAHAGNWVGAVVIVKVVTPIVEQRDRKSVV